MGLLAASIRVLTGPRRALDVAINDTNGNQLSGFDQSRPSTAALTQPATASTSGVVLAQNVNRRQVYVYNDSNKDLFLAFAATATLTAFTVVVPPNTQWKSDPDGYTGTISGILDSGTGTARVTEITT